MNTILNTSIDNGITLSHFIRIPYFTGSNLVVRTSLPASATGTVNLCLEGVDYEETLSNGRAVFSFPIVNIGHYTLDFQYSGDDNFNPTYDSINLQSFGVKPYLEDEHDHYVYQGQEETMSLNYGDNLKVSLSGAYGADDDSFDGYFAVYIDDTEVFVASTDEWKTGGAYYSYLNSQISIGNSFSLGSHTITAKYFNVAAQAEIASATPFTSCTLPFTIVNP